jgi:hypothetical protein
VIKKLIQAAALLAACSGAAHASTFDFSYTFTSGQTVSGSLDGTLSGNLVTNISDVSVNFDGTAYTGTLFAGSFLPSSTGGSYNYGANAAVVSTNAALNNFIFADNTDSQANNVTNWFYFVNGTTPTGSGTQELEAGNVNTGDIAFDNPGSGTWSLTPAPVPVPAALPLLMSGLGLLAAAKRRRQNQTAQS